MRVQNCFHPKVFRNPYTGVLVTARCGKCDACRNTRASNWVTRLDMEASCHKYTLFVTLTYDEQHVPQIIRLPFNKENKNYVPNYIDASTGEYFDFSDLALQKSDLQYLRDSRVLNVLSKRDFQLFIKRLRYYFDKTEAGALLRYYICGELGPRTYRPHGHMLLFFDSEPCAKNIELLLSKAWSDGNGKLYGNIYDPHFVSGSAAEYCACYINSLSQLPRNYLHKGLRPFSLFSKRPAIGTLYPSIKEVREVFDRGDIKFTRYDKSSCTFKADFFWRSFATRLYPRCQRFGCLSHDERVTLYRLIEEFPPFLSARQIARRIKAEFIDKTFSRWSSGRVRYMGLDTFLGRYFREIAFKKKKGVHFLVDKKIPWQVKGLPFLPSDSFEVDNIQAEKTIIKEYNENSLISFVNVLFRVRHQAQIFGISISDYVSKIELYYDNVNKQKLYDDYLYQSQYFLSHPKWHIIYFDKLFYDKVTQSDYSSWSSETMFFLESLFDVVPFKWSFDSRHQLIEVLDIPSLDSLQDFMSFKMLHSKIAHDLVKQKENNDYVLARKDRFGNIINYQNL